MKIKGKITFTDGNTLVIEEATRLEVGHPYTSINYDTENGFHSDHAENCKIRSFEFFGENVPDKLVDDVVDAHGETFGGA